MRCSNDLIAGLLVSCLIGATSCSGDSTDAAEANSLRPRFQGSPIGAAGSGGAGAGAFAGAGPGSASAGAGATAGAPGAAGVAGSSDDGGGGAPPEAAPIAPQPEAEPEGEESPPPIPMDVSFSDVFPILSESCTPCHATPGSQLPAFAQDDADAAYQVTQEPSYYENELYDDRIIVRGVVEGTMPPACGGGMLGSTGCLSERDAALLEAWIDQGAPR
jgi:hypothetical protein